MSGASAFAWSAFGGVARFVGLATSSPFAIALVNAPLRMLWTSRTLVLLSGPFPPGLPSFSLPVERVKMITSDVLQRQVPDVGRDVQAHLRPVALDRLLFALVAVEPEL